MPALARDTRKQLEAAVKAARTQAEAGVAAEVGRLGVGDAKPPAHLSEADRALRRDLRARGRVLGDELARGGTEKGVQGTRRLEREAAYEHWHRLLFARFLAENGLLIEPDAGVPVTLADVAELAADEGVDPADLTVRYAAGMLPQIFDPDDPVLRLSLPPERAQPLQKLVGGLPAEVFASDDGLGWVYQFWQAERKDAVNRAGGKIGADELPAVTQLFTEDYMVLFLLHNTLGAWWAGKKIAADPGLLDSCETESDCRSALALPGVDWEYLRFVRGDGEGSGEDDAAPWRPAAGTFPGWPAAAADLTVLDPCMGSGHFLTFALPILVALRAAEEDFDNDAAAVDAVLSDNLFGLELDERCTQIAAFNLALAAWRRHGGHRILPTLNLACSGLAPNCTPERWRELAAPLLRTANRVERNAVELALDDLHSKFEQAPVLGSLIDVTDRAVGAADWATVAPYLQRAAAYDYGNGQAAERHAEAVVAHGIADAAKLLAGPGGDEARGYTLLVTNVPYLARGKQDNKLARFCRDHFPDGKSDLATVFLQRADRFLNRGGTLSTVSPQNWLFLTSYSTFRDKMLKRQVLSCLVWLGPGAFTTISGEVVQGSLCILNQAKPKEAGRIFALSVEAESSPEAKSKGLKGITHEAPNLLKQSEQRNNPDSRVIIGFDSSLPLLATLADGVHGLGSKDTPRFFRQFWEVAALGEA